MMEDAMAPYAYPQQEKGRQRRRPFGRCWLLLHPYSEYSIAMLLARSSSLSDSGVKSRERTGPREAYCSTHCRAMHFGFPWKSVPRLRR